MKNEQDNSNSHNHSGSQLQNHSQRQNQIIFIFEQQDNRLIINAQTDSILYCAQFQTHQLISFDRLRKVLEDNYYSIVQKNNQTMKINVARLFDLDFKSKEKLNIDQFKESIQNLTLRLQSQIQKNQQLTQLTHNQQVKLQALQQKLSVLNNLEKTQKNHENLIQNLISTINSLKEEQSASITIRTQINQLKNQIMQIKNQNSQNKVSLQSVDEEKTSKITHLTTQFTQLRTQFDQLITLTIPKCLTLETQFMKCSHVVSTPEEKSILMNFFTKNIKRVNLLYRASQNQFCVKKFHEKCDGIANTLTVIWTEFNRKIGGFTPLKWSNAGSSLSVDDNQKASFLFSITHNDKFTMKQTGKAIDNMSCWGPTFGSGHDLHVCGKSNSTKNCHADSICTTYHNQIYKSKDKGSWERFHGEGTTYFKTRQWQVWQLDFA